MPERPGKVDNKDVESGGEELRRVRAILLAEESGKKIQERFPEIAQDYSNGLSLSALDDKYKISGFLGIKRTITERALQFALKGTKKYSGLIQDPETAAEIGKAHQVSYSRKNKEEKLGIFNQSKEDLKKLGQTSGIETRYRGTGIFAQTQAERSKLGKKNALERGLVPYSPEEISLIMTLSSLPENRLVNNKIVNTGKIAEIVNKQIHKGTPIRHSNSIAIFISRYKKSLRKSILPEVAEGAD